MKKIIIILLILIGSIAESSAQIQKGKYLFSTELNNLKFDVIGKKDPTLEVNLNGGKFISNKIALIADVNCKWVSDIGYYSLGINGRYYFNNINLFAGIGLGFVYICEEDRYYMPSPDVFRPDSKTLNYDIPSKIEVGYTLFLSKQVFIEPKLSYTHRNAERDYRNFKLEGGFNLNIGIGILL